MITILASFIPIIFGIIVIIAFAKVLQNDFPGQYYKKVIRGFKKFQFVFSRMHYFHCDPFHPCSFCEHYSILDKLIWLLRKGWIGGR